MLRPWIEQFAAHMPGTPGFKVDDAHAGRERTLWLVLAMTINDMRGVPNGTCGKQAPCICGACNICDAEGVSRCGRTILPGNARNLPPGNETCTFRQHALHFHSGNTPAILRVCNCACAGHALRSKFADSAGTDSYIKGLADLPPCGKRTKEDALNAGREFVASSGSMAKSKIKARHSRMCAARARAHTYLCLAFHMLCSVTPALSQALTKKSPYLGVGVMAECLPYHDPVKHTFYDMVHMCGNVIKGSLC
jgi:hypothetical protein